MNKKNVRLVLLYAVAIILIALLKPRELNWSPSFSKEDDIPFGSEAVYESLDALFDGQRMSVNEDPAFTFLKDTSIANTNLIIVNSSIFLDSLDLLHLLDFAHSGNHLFISAEEISSRLLDTLKVYSRFHWPAVSDLEFNTELRLHNNAIDSQYYLFRSQSIFVFEQEEGDSSEMYVLGSTDDEAQFIKIPFGDGMIYLHSFPYAFTNYYFIKEETRSYLSQAFSHLPANNDVIWDEYYKVRRQGGKQMPLSVLMRYPSFRWAYWISLVGLLSFMVFYAKRRQRAIPIYAPPKNDSLAYVKTLGGLYYNHGNNKDIAMKKIQVFKEYIAKHYHMRDIQLDMEEIEELYMRSGNSKENIEKIFKLWNTIQESSVTDGQLKILVKSINEFYNGK